MRTYRASDGALLYRSAANAGYWAPPAMTAGMAFALAAHLPVPGHRILPPSSVYGAVTKLRNSLAGQVVATLRIALPALLE